MFYRAGASATRSKHTANTTKNSFSKVGLTSLDQHGCTLSNSQLSKDYDWLRVGSHVRSGMRARDVSS